ncbi:sodium/proline symporter [Pyrococcus abyssi]|uniref:Proline or pantothenate permease n=1 Tax=Pyrococcus abyssi (strain GE5 / Orsay) TaxID=272844 RepID=Q9V0K5_PYRAB|nr:sodium/proline symporter [Pyrococcus abyssi]CAB49698.1 Proline or pantothenate permease [Pyrococcus abyssi GE5]CCE70181.1 TPA: proline permease (putP-2) [Pyrococcus abyssi GE5]
MNFGILFGFLIYLVILAYIGWWANKYTKTEDQYFVGGRKVHVLAATLSDKASDFSGWLMLGYPGSAFKAGLGAFWAGIGCLFGTLADYLLIGPRLRIYAGKFRAITLPDYLEARLKDNTKLIRILSAAIILVFMTAYVAAQFAAGGKTFAQAFNVSVTTGILITVIILTAYVITGGFFAVVWTDVVQAMFMLLTLIIMPILALVEIGGLDRATQIIASVDPNKLHPFGGATGWAAIVFAIGYASWIVGYLGQPHIVTRYMSVEDPRKLRRPGIFISGIWTTIVLWGAFFAGFLGFALVASGSIKVEDPERIVPAMAIHFLPGWVAGFVIAGIISAVMSTADSQLLVASSAIARDIYHKVLGQELGKKQMVNISRIVVAAVALVAMWFAITGPKVIYQMVATAWGGLAVGFGPILTLSLWWKRVTKEAGIVGMAYGLISEVILEAKIYGWAFNPKAPGFFGTLGQWFNGVPVFFINFFVTLFIIIIVSLLTKPPEDVVKLHEELFKKVPIEKSEKIKTARMKSQAENVFDFAVSSGLL